MKSKHLKEIAILWMLLSIPLVALSQDNLLIIAPDDFIDELQPLRRFKDASVRPTTLVSLNQIYVDPRFSGADEAEQVKRCIAYYEQNNKIKHVLLVGDIDQFPTRYRWWGLQQQEYWGVTDLYYADLYKNGTRTFDDWDVNNNGLYGEIEFTPHGSINNDQIDFLPDVSVGRVPASTEAEVIAYVNKVIEYEMKVLPSSSWFKKAALYTGAWWSAHNTLKDDIAGYLSNKGFTQFIKRYTDFSTNPPTTPAGTPGVLISDLNSGVGLVNYAGHGNSDGWPCVNLYSSDLSGLTNFDKLPVVFSAGCETGMFARMARFEPYLDVNGGEHYGANNGETLDLGAYPHTSLPRPACIQNDADGGVSHGGVFYTYDMECFAETFLFGYHTDSTGAIAYVGARTGTRPNQAAELDRQFFKAYESGKVVLGEMWKYMLQQYYNNYELSGSHTWFRDSTQWNDGHTLDEPQKFILFGDPSLVVGGAFGDTKSGTVYDNNGGPLNSYSRYRITGNIDIPSGKKLTVNNYASVFFNAGTKITATSPGSNEGLIVNGASDKPVYCLSLSENPQSKYVACGMRIKGQMRIHNGGEIKLH